MQFCPMLIAILLAADTLWSDSGTGPWSTAPVRWYGDTANAVRTASGVQLNAPASGKTFLWADAPIVPPAEWRGQVVLNFNPSSSNYFEMRFAEDGSGNGVGARFGASDDCISLGKLTKNSLTTWTKSNPGILSNARSEIRWKLTWSRQNYWTLAFSLDSNWVVLDSTVFSPTAPARYVGLKAVYTSSNRNRFTVGPLSVFGRVQPEPVGQSPPDKPAPMNETQWRITEVLAAPDPTRPGAPSVDFVEVHYTGTDTIRTEGWSLAVNQYSYPLSAKQWTPGEVAILGDSNGFSPQLRRLVWHGKIQVLSSYCWIQLRDAYRRPVVQSHIDPKWFVPADKSKGGFSWEAQTKQLTCLSPIGWSVCSLPGGSSPGVLSVGADSAVGARTGGIRRWRWDDERTLEVVFRHPMSCINRKETTLSIDSITPDSIWAVSPWTWLLRWEENLDWSGAHSKSLRWSGTKHCDGTDLDTVLIVGWPESAEPGEWKITELLLNPLPGESRYLELQNTSEKWLNVGDLRVVSVDPVTRTDLSYRILAEPGVCIAPKSCIVLSESWVRMASDFSELDSFRFYKSAAALPWNDDLAVGRIEDENGQPLIAFHAEKSDHFLGLMSSEGHSLVPVYEHQTETAQLEWTSHAPGSGSPGISQPFVAIPNANGRWSVRNNRCRWGAPAVVEYHDLAQPVLAECWISTPSGQRILQLMHQELLDSSGLLVWDGRMSNGFLAPDGTYLMCVRGVDAKNRSFAKSWGIQVR
ncbi:MAG: hypothetical protein RLZZ114_819 [Bacteroidota bacterium]